MLTHRIRNHPTSQGPGSHAVVIGGSMAGLLAARVLANHFDRVTIIERDRFPEGPEHRKGVPQARHAHVLLGRGQQLLEPFFPGITRELEEADAPRLDAAQDIAWLTPEGWATRFRSGLDLLSASRDLLEWAVRRRVLALEAVRVVEEADVLGLATDDAGTTVRGVTLRRRHASEGEPAGFQRLDTDLVVDASGRASHAPQWLAALGYPVPEETIVNSYLGYASRLYQMPATAERWKALYIQSKAPDGRRGGLILPIEGGRWLVTLSGLGGDYPPTDEAGFAEFAKSLPSPTLCKALAEAHPLAPVSGYRSTENRLRHYERLPRWPENFVVLGDAACAFNPVYGQGMTTAALGAQSLGECLGAQNGRTGLRRGLAKQFQTRLARVNTVPWMLATAEDFRYPTTLGSRPGWLTRLQQRYLDRVLRLGTSSCQVRRIFLEVLHMLRPPSALFSPGVLLPVLRQVLTEAA